MNAVFFTNVEHLKILGSFFHIKANGVPFFDVDVTLPENKMYVSLIKKCASISNTPIQDCYNSLFVIHRDNDNSVVKCRKYLFYSELNELNEQEDLKSFLEKYPHGKFLNSASGLEEIDA